MLQAAFGAALTLPDDVCGRCNTEVLGPLDDRLTDLVRRFVYWDDDEITSKSSPLQQGLKIFLADSGTWLSGWLGRDHKIRIPPQVIFLGGGAIRFAGDEASPARVQQLFATIEKELKRPVDLKLSDELRQPREPPIQPALIRTAPRNYVLRAQDRGAIERLRAALSSGTLLVDIAQSNVALATTVNPTLEGQIAIDFGRAERAIAKAALNFACVVLGPAAVRSDVFSPIRQFITQPSRTESVGFVSFLFEENVPIEARRFSEAMVRPGCHTLLFAVPDGVPLVNVTLYGRPFAVVYLVQNRDRVPNDLLAPTLATFDYRAKTHELVRMRDDAIRFACKLFGGNS